MKKLFFFFSTLFFILIPHSSAETSSFLHLDFRSGDGEGASQPILYNSINNLKTTNCTASGCTGDTFYNTYEALIDELDKLGYSYILNFYQEDGLYSGSYSLLWIIDTEKTDMTDLYLSTKYLNNRTYLNITSNSDIYYWSFMFYPNAANTSLHSFYNIDNIQDKISSSSSTNSGTWTNFIYWNNDGTLSSIFPYYVSDDIDFKYDFTNSINNSKYEFNIYSDFNTNPDNPLTITDSLGPATNYLFYLRTYTDKLIFSPPEEPEPTPDNPNQGIEDGLGNLNDSINSSDISGSEGAFNEFFGNFESDDHGLFAIVSTPLNFIKSFLNSVCTPLVLPLPFVDTDVTLPCMEYVYSEFFGNFFSAYQTITTGIVSYWVCINILRIVKDMKDSEKDTIEVLDL